MSMKYSSRVPRPPFAGISRRQGMSNYCSQLCSLLIQQSVEVHRANVRDCRCRTGGVTQMQKQKQKVRSGALRRLAPLTGTA
eukprot:7225431-Pyramimonas_sp.AAC.1